MDTYKHIPVFANSICEYLDIQPGNVILDCTCGEGGHGEIILQKFCSQVFYIGLDRDPEILEIAKKRLQLLSKKVLFLLSPYSKAKEALEDQSILHVDRILVDLGVSMFQLMHMERGFSFNSDEKLDMRFNQTEKSITAFEIVNAYKENEISDIIYAYGEEHASRRIARNIISERKRKPINTCAELARIVSKSKGFIGKIHPATQTFQALRIYVNSEFNQMESLFSIIPSMLNVDGKVAFITYHSLEDRRVKIFMRQTETIKPVNKKVIIPDLDELNNNPASRSAKLRIGVRI